MLVGIDSSMGKRFSCFVFGSFKEVNLFYENVFTFIKKDCGWSGSLHWRKMSRRTRNCILKKFLREMHKTQLKFFIFEHKKPKGVSRRDYFLKTVPNEVSHVLEPLFKATSGVVLIECDEDFEVKGVHNSSTLFLNRLVKSISYKIVGKKVAVFISKGRVYADIKHDSKKLHVRASIVKSRNSKAVQIADLVLGIFNQDKKKLEGMVTFKKL